jgi:hypothetical protein
MTAPTYPLTMPTSPGFVQSSFAIRRAVAVAQSPFTGQSQSYEHPMALWVAQVQLPPMKRATAAAWQAFLLKLHGRSGTFLLGDPDAKVPRGAISLSATPTLNAAANAGDYQVELTGVGTSIVAFRAGDYIQLGSAATARLYMIVDDATSDGSGVVTVTIEPSIRVTVASGGAVVYQSAKTVFRLDANDIGWDADHVSRFGISFSCTEAI